MGEFKIYKNGHPVPSESLLIKEIKRDPPVRIEKKKKSLVQIVADESHNLSNSFLKEAFSPPENPENFLIKKEGLVVIDHSSFGEGVNQIFSFLSSNSVKDGSLVLITYGLPSNMRKKDILPIRELIYQKVSFAVVVGEDISVERRFNKLNSIVHANTLEEAVFFLKNMDKDKIGWFLPWKRNGDFESIFLKDALRAV